MSTSSKIEWTRGDDGTPGATWNPVTGCTEVSPGCDRCYAKTFAERWRGVPGHHFENGFDVQIRPDKLTLPLKWRKPRRVFVNSMSDLFHKDVPDEYIAQVFGVMALTPQHTYQVLTKRHGRMRSLLNSGDFRLLCERQQDALVADDSTPMPRYARNQYLTKWWSDFAKPLPNVWLGVSVEDQQRADLRIPALLETAAAVRFLSCEPLLGELDLTRWLRPVPGCGHVDPDDGTCLHPEAFTPECWRGSDCPLVRLGGEWHGPDWVIVGGESGHGARPMDTRWAEEIVHQCQVANVPVFVKQLGIRAGGKAHHDIDTFPEALRVREFPGAVAAS